MIIQILCAIALIVSIAAQTTKNEAGLSGVIGGKSSSSLRGRPGIDDLLHKWTKIFAIGFMVASAAVAIASNRGL